MDAVTDRAVIALMNVYAKYFVEDFAGNVLSQVKASFPVEDSQLKAFITREIENKLTAPVNLNAINPATRFLCEVATHALENFSEDPEGRDTYDAVKNLPSIHHDDLNEIAYTSAALYKQTIDQTLLGVVVQDAKNAAQSIFNAATARTTSTMTGGTLHSFNWGILSDGLWLNGALGRAYELASIFRPGDTVVAYYATVGFDFARHYAPAPVFEDGGEAVANGYLNALIDDISPNILNPFFDVFDQSLFANLLFTPGVLSRYIDEWYLGLKNPSFLIQGVTQLSALASILDNLITATNNFSEERSSSVLEDRLNSVYNAVTLCLAAFEALRETTYNDTIIIDVAAEGTDPVVDVFVNVDLLNTYKAAGGTEDDLIKIGTYVDPRKGLPTPNSGWKIDWALTRREDIVSEVISSEEERLTALRNNDAAVIQDIVIRTLKNIVTSYADAARLPAIPNDALMKINEISRLVTNPEVQVSIEDEIVGLLVNVIGDPFVQDVASRFVSLASSEDENARTAARALTVASTAVNDSIGFITAEEPYNEVV